MATARRYNLQETLAHAIFERVAAMRGVRALRVTTAKPDIYAEARGVGVEIASFELMPKRCPAVAFAAYLADAEQNPLRGL